MTDAAGRTITVLIADDQALVRTGLRMILETRADCRIVGEAADGADAVRLAEETRPDIVLMDLRMPGVDGIEATRRLALSPHRPSVIALTTFDEDELLYAALRAGASGFLLKDARPAELVDAVRVVAGGDALLAPRVTRRLLDRFVAETRGERERTPRLADLTSREVDVLTLIAQAASNAEIATKLAVTEGTVKTHVSAILRKLELRDRVQAVVLAYDLGLVRPRPSGVD
ncbi:LuxR family two component transcriptional regulator [Nocardia tenerifensis]|uniref:LuxR family two component transcriptional regulator n=1 Tax=Nocardia tenerifensis TaxID=228006 RepID=A0A318JZK7_9NOCA|nr:response regulator transcription factor [Nocardia tenerifensis]PXX61098.1 LuxR family two component transcriptional regulator [Nocardia tenerifensis]